MEKLQGTSGGRLRGAGEIRVFSRSAVADLFWRLLAWVDWRSAAAFSLPLLLFLFTLAPTIYNLDSAELTTAAASGGLVRATGYPLYLALGALWSKLPIGDVGYRMNLFSALNGALTILLAERILRRWRVASWATFGSLGLLAAGVYFWGLSLVAEVYTLHTALMAALILALLNSRERQTPAGFFFVGLCFGLGLSHHLATILLAPACVIYILLSSHKTFLKPSGVLAILLGLLAGLSLYLTLPLRQSAAPAFNYAGFYDANLVFHPVNLWTFSGMWWLVTGQSFAGQMFAYRGWEILLETRHFIQELWRAFFAFGVGPGLLGMFLVFRRPLRSDPRPTIAQDWRSGVMLALMFAASAGFYINYRVIDKDTMYLSAYLIWSLWVGVGLQALLDWTKKATAAQVRLWSHVVLSALIVLGVLLALVWNWRIVDLSRDWTTRQRGVQILAEVEQGALVFGWWNTVPVLQYLQFVEGSRPDILAINRFLISPQHLLTVIEKEGVNRAIYIDSVPNGLSSDWSAQKAGLLYRLQTSRTTSASGDSQENAP